MLEDFPDMFVGDMSLAGHIGSRDCRSSAGFALKYSNSGKALTVAKVDTISFKKPTTCSCFSKASRQNPTALVSSSSPTTTRSSSDATQTGTITKPTTLTVSKITPTIATMLSPTTRVASTTKNAPGSANSNPSQCSSYVLITDKTRHATHPHYIGCDKGTFKPEPMWVRFSGAAGTRLAPGPMEPFHCGTQGTGWYKGEYPVSVGATTSGTICYSWLGNMCQWSNQVSITNCNGYYVFALRALPACYLRYCTV